MAAAGAPCVSPGNGPVTFERLTPWDAGLPFVMKTLIVSATIAALTLSSALADRPVVEQKVQSDNADYEYVTVTGSHIKQKIRKRHTITDTRTGNVLTIDQREMQRNGDPDMAGQLSRYPGISISHH
jgi:outer membrane receptor for Fe3+-dicitrate